jgi:hypothetical protein
VRRDRADHGQRQSHRGERGEKWRYPQCSRQNQPQRPENLEQTDGAELDIADSGCHPIGPAASRARGCVSFVTPVARKIAASSTWAVQSAVSMRRTIVAKQTSCHHAFCVIGTGRRLLSSAERGVINR